jgi:hypothetical protein
MPAITVPTDQLALGPGYLYWAPLATAAPANTVAGSVFTDAWSGGWIPLGATDNGHELGYALSVDEVEVEEYLDPIKYVTVKRVISVKFAGVQIGATAMKRAVNGGTITVTGTTATTLSKLSPVAVGQEVRAMIGWESSDFTERFVGYQALQIGSLSIKRQKGAAKATLDLEFKFEQPSAGTSPWDYWTAGAVRV